jgi:ABC-type Fe3+-hydroxamate transport system substrate-binding protein
VTIEGIPHPVPLVGIVSDPFRRDNGGAGSREVRLAVALAAILLLSACAPQERGANPEEGIPPESALQESIPDSTHSGPADLEAHSDAGEPGAGSGSAGTGAPAFPVTVGDVAGRVLSFEAPPGRIVSLVPSATRTLEALGARDLLVGRTAYDTSASLSHLPSVGEGLQPSLEALLALLPDLVVRYAGASDRVTPIRLDERGVRHLAVRPDRMEDVRSLIRDLGAVTGRGHQADSLLAHMDAVFREIRKRVAGRPAVRVAYLLGGNPPWVAGPGTFIHELLSAAGGENSFADLEVPYGPVSPEELLVRNIELILAPEGEELSLPPSSPPVVRVSPDMELPGPDLARVAWDLAVILHPQVLR